MQKRYFLLIALGLFLAYSFLPLSAPANRSNSPDEASNYYFAGVFHDTGRLWSFEPLNLVVKAQAHPRSMRVVDDLTVPGGFIGLPLIYGALSVLFTMKAVPFLTPLFATLAVFAWGALVRRWFGPRVGALAAVLLAIHPVWWYETARTLFPNVAFLSFVIIAAYLFFEKPLEAAAKKRKYEGAGLLTRADAAVAGIMAGLALAIRPVEVYWLALMALVLTPFADRALFKRAALAVVFAALVLAPFLSVNQTLYGSIFGSGYGSVVEVDNSMTTNGGRAAQALGPLRPYLFPLGFAPRTAAANFWDFGVAFFGVWSLAVFASLICLGVFVKRVGYKVVKRSPGFAFSVAALAAALWLLMFYGSYVTPAGLHPDARLIGSSYLRYWLPIFVASTVPVAWALATLIDHRLRRTAGALMLGCYLGLSVLAVFFSPDEGLLAVRAHLISYDRIDREIESTIDAKSVIVTDYADKFLFPDHSVIQPLRSSATYDAIGSLAGHKPLYYYGITLPATDLDWLKEHELKPRSVGIEAVKTFGEETLYQLTALPNASPVKK